MNRIGCVYTCVCVCKYARIPIETPLPCDNSQLFYFYKLFSAFFYDYCYLLLFFYQHMTCVRTQTSMENSLWMIDKYASNFLCKYINIPIYLKKIVVSQTEKVLRRCVAPILRLR